MSSERKDTEPGEGSLDALRSAQRIAQDTAPGKRNSVVLHELEDVHSVVDSFIEELNNWVEIIDVRTYRNKKIGIPCRYRWTIKRWVVNDMDQWLVDNGWMKNAHLRADSKEHRKNEMEARYSKEIEGYTVYANIYVEFTEDVFDSLEDGSPIRAAKNRRVRKDKAQEFREKKMKKEAE